jgi:pentapeptide repeat protein
VFSDEALADSQKEILSIGTRPFHEPWIVAVRRDSKYERKDQSLDLSYSDLSGADLSYADLGGANLGAANLSEASDLTEAQIDQAKGDSHTILPKDLRMPEGWKERR